MIFREGKLMLKLTEGLVHVVAADARAALEDFDSTYVAALRLAANAVEGLKKSGLPAGQGQQLCEGFNQTFAKLVEGRDNLVANIAKLQVFHRHSNQAEVSGGCPVPWGFFVTGQADEAAAAQDHPQEAQRA